MKNKTQISVMELNKVSEETKTAQLPEHGLEERKQYRAARVTRSLCLPQAHSQQLSSGSSKLETTFLARDTDIGSSLFPVSPDEVPLSSNCFVKVSFHKFPTRHHAPSSGFTLARTEHFFTGVSLLISRNIEPWSTSHTNCATLTPARTAMRMTTWVAGCRQTYMVS